VDVNVSNLNGSSTLVGGFTYDDPPVLTSLAPTNGTPLGGTSVVLTGTGFTAGDAVTFDGIAAAVTFDSATQLTVTAPAHAAGAVDVNVSNLNGSSTLVGGFTYDNPPTITALTPNSGVIAGGESIVVTGTNFVGSEAVTFDGLAAVVVFDSATQLTVTTPAHASGTVNVVVTNVNGTDTLVGGFTYVGPPVLISVAPTNGSPLGGDTVTLTGTDFTAGDTVTFDGLAAAATFLSTTSLSVVTPAHAPGAVDVVVSNVNGSSTLSAGFTYDTPPVITSVTPNNGSPLGGDTVTILGTDLTATSVVTFGASVPVAVALVSPTEVTVVTPAGTAGAVDVTLTNANGASTLSSAYTYNTPANLLVVNPNNGSPLGGQAVTLLGNGFTPDVSVTFDGVPAISVAFISPTSVLATTPAHAPGAVDVALTTINGTSTLVGGFTYNPQPTITSLSPGSGPPSGGTSVTLAGTGFLPGTTVRFDGIIAPATIVSTTQIFTASPAHAAGVVDVTVTNTNGTGTLANSFTYLSPPTLTLVAPSMGSPAGGTLVTLTGSGFDGTETVSFDGLPATAVTLISPTSLTALTPAHATGTVNVSVTNGNGSDTLVGGYTYEGAPTITSVAPNTGTSAGGDSVVITGSNFLGSETVTFDGVAVASVTFDSSTMLTVVTPAHFDAIVDVVVTNVNGSATLTNGFTYGTPAPTPTSITPANGPRAGGTTVMIAGSNFTAADTVTFDGIAATSVTFNSATSLTAVTPAHAAGTVNVTVTNANGPGTLPSGFTYDAPPTIASITPASGTPTGGTALVVTGTDFVTGTTVSIGGNTCGTIVVTSPTQITCFSPVGVGGAADVTVSNANGADTLTSGFNYDLPPTITSITPDTGNPAGGDNVTITGTSFDGTTDVLFDGVPAAAVVFLGPTSLAATTPAGAAGSVDVTVTNQNGSDSLIGGYTYLSPNVMRVADASGTPGSGVSLVVELITVRDVKGYTTAMTFDNTNFTLQSMDINGLDVQLLLGPIQVEGGVEFFNTTIDNPGGFGIAAAVFDLSAPFLGQNLSAGGPYTIVRYNFDTTNSPTLIGTTHNFDLVDGLGSPPVNNAVSYQNEIGQTLTLNPQRQRGVLTFVDTQTFKRADANGDGNPNIADAIFLITYLFNAGAAPQCQAAANSNGDLLIDISDIITIIQWQFAGGSQPPAPFPNCGADTGTTFDCGSYNGC
ncbi:MAG: IPT/TIG domain-containing protein, partial [Planctomycetota bacterium]